MWELEWEWEWATHGTGLWVRVCFSTQAGLRIPYDYVEAQELFWCRKGVKSGGGQTLSLFGSCCSIASCPSISCILLVCVGSCSVASDGTHRGQQRYCRGLEQRPYRHEEGARSPSVIDERGTYVCLVLQSFCSSSSPHLNESKGTFPVLRTSLATTEDRALIESVGLVGYCRSWERERSW